MTGEAVQLHTPLGDEVLSLRAGDHVELSGIVYTARDEAHMRMKKSGIPFDPAGCCDLPLWPGSAGQPDHCCRSHYFCTDERTIRVLHWIKACGLSLVKEVWDYG